MNELIPIFRDHDGHYYRVPDSKVKDGTIQSKQGGRQSVNYIPEQEWLDYVGIRSLYETAQKMMDRWFEPKKYVAGTLKPGEVVKFNDDGTVIIESGKNPLSLG